MLAPSLALVLLQGGEPPTLALELDAGAPGAHLAARCGPPIPGRPFCLGVNDGSPGQLGWLGLGPIGAPLSLAGIAGTIYLTSFTDSRVFALDANGVSEDLFSTPPLDPAFVGTLLIAQGATLGPTLAIELTNGLGLQVGAPGSAPFEGIPVADLAGDAVDEVVVGDFNGDGFGDVVSYLYRVNQDITFAVHHGRPDGTLELVQFPTFTDCDQRSGLTSADFTGDGRLDIALGCAWKNEVKVYAGLPSGQFALDSTVALLGDPKLDRADVTGVQLDSGSLGDFAVTLSDSFEVEIHFNPLGSTPSILTVPTLAKPSLVEFADLNGDGWKDLIVGTENAFFGAAGTVAVHLNTGAGSFGPLQYVAVSPSGSESISGVKAGDLNGDGLVDLATAFRYEPGVAVVLGNGDGTFGAPTVLALDEPCSSVNVGDVDGDGAADVLAVGLDTSEPHWWTHVGGDSFAPGKRIHPLGPAPTRPSVHDMNADGSPDIAFGSRLGFAAVLFAQNPGVFPFPDQRFVGTNPSQQIATDMNADGWQDLVTVTRDFVGAWYSLNVRLGTPAGTYQVTEAYTMATKSAELAVGDFNGDGYSDLAFFADELPAFFERIDIRLGNGDGTTTPWTSLSTSNVNATFIAVLDADNDGNADLAWSDTSANGPVKVRIGSGTGSFGAQASIPKDITSGTLGTVHDMDGDGDEDLIVGNSRDVQVFLNVTVDPSTPLVAQPSLVATGTALPCGPLNSFIREVAAGDLNGDGLADLALAVQACSSSEEGLAIALATGPGVFAPAELVTTLSPDGQHVRIVDVDLDGDADVVFASAGTLEIYPGLGDGTVGEVRGFLSGGGADDLFVTDFDLDGTLDLGLTSSGNNWVSRFVNRIGDQ
jgi:hypothetical protein